MSRNRPGFPRDRSRRRRLGVPVDQALAAEDVAVAEPVEEGEADSQVVALVHGEAGARPVAGAAELLQLAEDARLVLVLPLPGPAQELLAADLAGRFPG